MIATPQHAGRPEACPTRTLPPSERDFEIYQQVAIEGQSTRAAAGQVGLSQTRIVQIRDRVAEWIGSEVPPTAKLTPAQRLVVAVDLAARRFDFLYSESMEGWRQQKGQPGDVRYLSQAARITERSIVVSQREAAARQAIEKVEDRSGESGVGSRESRATESPPAGDCSGVATPRPVERDRIAEAVETNGCQTKVSDDDARRRGEFLADLESDTSPIQPPITDAHGMQLDESAETELEQAQHKPNLSAERAHGFRVCSDTAEGEGLPSAAAEPPQPINRKQRRARQRMLERALARKRR